MNIEATGYKIELTESELFVLIFALKHELESPDKIEHSKHWSGMKTYLDNYGNRIVIYEAMCIRIGRRDIFDETMQLVLSELEPERKETK